MASRLFPVLLVLVAALSCDREPTGEANRALAPGPVLASDRASVAPVLPDLPASCSGLYTRPLTTGTGGLTYYNSYDCSGQAYGVDGFCAQTPCTTALSTFGCAMDWDSCNGPVGTHSKRTYGYLRLEILAALVNGALLLVISGAIVAFVSLYLLWSGRLVVHFHKGMSLKPDWKIIRELFRFGLPTGFQGVAMNVAGVFLLRFVGSLEHSAQAQAAYAVSYGEMCAFITWTSQGLLGATCPSSVSKKPFPSMHEYSAPLWLKPRNRIAAPPSSTRRFPSTRSPVTGTADGSGSGGGAV